MKYFKKVRPIIGFFVFFVEIASNLEKFSINFSTFNPFPSLPSVATNDRKQNKRHNIVLNNKLRLLFLEFSPRQNIFGVVLWAASGPFASLSCDQKKTLGEGW